MSWRILIFLDHSKLKNVHINLENQVALRWIGLVLTGAMFLILTRYQPKIFRETFDLQVTYDSNRILGEKWGVNIWKMKIDLQVFLKVPFGSNPRSSNGDPPMTSTTLIEVIFLLSRYPDDSAIFILLGHWVYRSVLQVGIEFQKLFLPFQNNGKALSKSSI